MPENALRIVQLRAAIASKVGMISVYKTRRRDLITFKIKDALAVAPHVRKNWYKTLNFEQIPHKS